MSLINYVTKIQFGYDSLQHLAAEAERAGITRPLIVTDVGVLIRIGRGGVEDCRCAVTAEGSDDFVDDAGIAHADVGDDQRTGDAGALGFGGQVLQAVVAELDFGDVIDE